MATIERTGASNDVLIVRGEDPDGDPIYGDGYGSRLKQALHAAQSDESPVRRGTHDFWITYPVPGLGGGMHAGEDLSITPRKMRGLVRMPLPNPNELGDHLTVLLQEVGHHWLVPKGLRHNEDGESKSLPKSLDMLIALREGRPLPHPLLLGRAESHWSSFFQSDGSCMDGQDYDAQQVSNSISRWKRIPGLGLPSVQASGLTDVEVPSRYGDLDLYLMGIKTADEVFLNSSGAFTWLEPHLTVPMQYDAALFVAFANGPALLFGFHEDHRRFEVRRAGGGAPSTVSVNAVAPLPPWTHLRIVRLGSRLRFEVLKGAFSSSANPFPWPFATWRTVADLPEKRDPLAVGVVMATGQAMHAECVALDPTLVVGGLTIRLEKSLPPSATIAGAAAGKWVAHQPVPGSIVSRIGPAMARLVAPRVAPATGGDYETVGAFPYTEAEDGAPKIVARTPPGGAFTFSTGIKVQRTTFSPWTAGSTAGKTVWGHARSMQAKALALPSRLTSEEQPPPEDDTYRFAFIIVALDGQDVSNYVDRIDHVRRYWKDAFEKATIGRRHADVSL